MQDSTNIGGYHYEQLAHGMLSLAAHVPIGKLLGVLTDGKVTSITMGELDAVLAQKNFHVERAMTGAPDHAMIGMACVHLHKERAVWHETHQVKPLAYVDDVVVDPAHQGKGIARQLMINLIKRAGTWGAVAVELTSAPHRKAANHLYKSMGFEFVDDVIAICDSEPIMEAVQALNPDIAARMMACKADTAHFIRTLIGKKLFSDRRLWGLTTVRGLTAEEFEAQTAGALECLKKYAAIQGATQINVTVPRSQAGSATYPKCGYQIRETNVYRLKLPVDLESLRRA